MVDCCLDAVRIITCELTTWDNHSEYTPRYRGSGVLLVPHVANPEKKSPLSNGTNPLSGTYKDAVWCAGAMDHTTPPPGVVRGNMQEAGAGAGVLRWKMVEQYSPRQYCNTATGCRRRDPRCAGTALLHVLEIVGVAAMK